MTDNERLGKIWEFVKERLADIDRGNDEFDWGMKSAFEEVLDFMDDLMD